MDVFLKISNFQISRKNDGIFFFCQLIWNERITNEFLAKEFFRIFLNFSIWKTKFDFFHEKSKKLQIFSSIWNERNTNEFLAKESLRNTFSIKIYTFSVFSTKISQAPENERILKNSKRKQTNYERIFGEGPVWKFGGHGKNFTHPTSSSFLVQYGSLLVEYSSVLVQKSNSSSLILDLVRRSFTCIFHMN